MEIDCILSDIIEMFTFLEMIMALQSVRMAFLLGMKIFTMSLTYFQRVHFKRT